MRTLRTMYILTLACAALPLSGCMGGSTSSGNGSVSLEQQVQQQDMQQGTPRTRQTARGWRRHGLQVHGVSGWLSRSVMTGQAKASAAAPMPSEMPARFAQSTQ